MAGRRGVDPPSGLEDKREREDVGVGVGTKGADCGDGGKGVEGVAGVAGDCWREEADGGVTREGAMERWAAAEGVVGMGSLGGLRPFLVGDVVEKGSDMVLVDEHGGRRSGD